MLLQAEETLSWEHIDTIYCKQLVQLYGTAVKRIRESLYLRALFSFSIAADIDVIKLVDPYMGKCVGKSE